MASKSVTATKIDDHGFPPLYDSESEILILGSFPSVKSREQGFYYGHPQNRFWKVISGVFEEKNPQNIEEKKSFCLLHHIALYDSVFSCTIVGSSDASIRDVVPSDLNAIIRNSKIRKIILNGKAAEKYFRKYQAVDPMIEICVCPSTSPANAACSLEKLKDEWGLCLK